MIRKSVSSAKKIGKTVKASKYTGPWEPEDQIQKVGDYDCVAPRFSPSS